MKLTAEDFSTLCRILGKKSVEELNTTDFDKFIINYYVQQIYDKKEILSQLSDGINKIINAMNIADNDTCLCVQTLSYNSKSKVYSSYEDWYNDFLQSIKNQLSIQTGSNIINIIGNTSNHRLIISNPNIVHYNTDTIYSRISTKIYNDYIENSNDPEIQDISNYDSTSQSLLKQYFEQYAGIVKDRFPASIFCMCSNELALKLIDIYSSNIEQLVMDDINEQEEKIAINRDANECGGFFNWNYKDPEYSNFDWIKKSQVVLSTFNKNISSEYMPFNITFKNVDRKHSLEVSGDVCITYKNNQYDALIKLKSTIIHTKGEDDKSIEEFKKPRYMKNKILEKLKSYFIDVVEE